MLLASQFIENVIPAGSVTSGLATLSLAVAVGIALGNVRIFGVRLGVAAVLFSALLFAQVGLSIDPQVIAYFRDFALVLFVYTIGLQMGPGFVASLRAEGLRLNVLAVTVVVLGAVAAGLIVKFAKLPPELAPGIFTGGFATTPALAAGQEALRGIAARGGHIDAKAAVAATNLAYSVAYPFGLMGPILLVVVLRVLFRVDMTEETAKLKAADHVRRPPLAMADIEVTNETLAGAKLRDPRLLGGQGVLFTRVLRGSTQTMPTAKTDIQVGDVFRAVGPAPAVDAVLQVLGRRSAINLAEAAGGGAIARANLIVTRGSVLGKTLRELDLSNRHGVTLARVNRAGTDMPARAALKLQFGDDVTAVGPENGLKAVETELGNATDALNTTQLIPIFLGIWLGIVAGSVPIAVPGMHDSLRIGLAGGPMLVAILLSRLGHVGSVVWYMPPAASQLLRDFGMAVFLACVGFQSGDHFLQNLVYGGGLPLVAWGAVVTLVPMAIVATFARLVWKTNFITLSGLISGAMTSSPTLLFANEATGSNAPAVAYAAVYPLSMLVPIFCSQLLVTVLVR